MSPSASVIPSPSDGGLPVGSIPPGGGQGTGGTGSSTGSGGGFNVPTAVVTQGFGSLGGVGPVSLGSIVRWLVPTFLLALPGLLIILAIGAQIVTGFTFMQLTRRYLGAAKRRRDRSDARG